MIKTLRFRKALATVTNDEELIERSGTPSRLSSLYKPAKLHAIIITAELNIKKELDDENNHHGRLPIITAGLALSQKLSPGLRSLSLLSLPIIILCGIVKDQSIAASRAPRCNGLLPIFIREIIEQIMDLCLVDDPLDSFAAHRRLLGE